jgi:hypothetical protein
MPLKADGLLAREFPPKHKMTKIRQIRWKNGLSGGFFRVASRNQAHPPKRGPPSKICRARVEEGLGFCWLMP